MAGSAVLAMAVSSVASATPRQSAAMPRRSSGVIGASGSRGGFLKVFSVDTVLSGSDWTDKAGLSGH
jgi:hypothetical protein